MLCLALGGVSFLVVLGERKDEVERLTLTALCLHLVLLLFLDRWYSCLFPSLVMRVGGVVCHPGAVLESVVSGVFPWVVSEGECCVLLLEVGLSKLWLGRGWTK